MSIFQLQRRLREFSIRTPDKDLKQYQKLLRENFSDLKTYDEMSEHPYLVDGEPVQDFQGHPVVIHDFEVRMGLEKNLRSAYYLYLYRDEFDDLLNQTASSFLTPKKSKKGGLDPRQSTLSLSEALKLNEKNSQIQTIDSEEAYQRFLKTGSMPVNALDALHIEAGFLKSTKNIKEISNFSGLQELIRRTENELYLAKLKDYDALAALYWDALRSRATDEFVSLASDGDSTPRSEIQDSSGMFGVFWNLMKKSR
jgi:hypothetical protein